MIELRLSNFKEFMAQNPKKSIPVYIYKTSCHPCKVVGPKYNKLADAYENDKNFIFTKLDVTDAAYNDVMNTCPVTGLPTFHIYQDSHKILNVSGVSNFSVLREYIEKNADKQKDK